MIYNEVSIVFPARNEEENILSTLNRSKEVFPRHFKEWEIIVVDDGSIDNTRSIVERVSQGDRRFRIIPHEKNFGYGRALRSGFREAKFGLIFFSDSDCQFDLNEIELLLPYLEEGDIVTGFRIKRADPFYRNLNAWLYNSLVRIVFGIKIRDVNCAFKFIRRSVLDAISLESEGALINAEVLYKAKKNGANVIEVPVHHYPRMRGSQTGAKPAVIFRMFFELLKWRMKWR